MKRLDTLSWYIVTLHQIIGHDKAATYLGQSAGDKALCILCMYEKGTVTKDEVIERMGR